MADKDTVVKAIRMNKSVAESYEKQLKAEHTTFAKRVTKLIYNDLNSLDFKIEDVKRQMKEFQSTLAEYEELKKELIKNPPIPNRTRDELTPIIDGELETINQSYDVWGPGELEKRVMQKSGRYGVSVTDALKLYRERALIVLNDSKKLYYFDQSFNYVRDKIGLTGEK